MDLEKNRKSIASHVSVNSIEFFGLFLTIVGMITAIFSPRMGRMEVAMSIFGYIVIGVGVVAILGGCIFSFMTERKKRDSQAEVEVPFPVQFSLPLGNQTITRRGSSGNFAVSHVSETCNGETRVINFEQVKFSSLPTDGSTRTVMTTYPEEPPPSYYEVMGMPSVSGHS